MKAIRKLITLFIVALILVFVTLIAPVMVVKAASFTSPPVQTGPMDLDTFMNWLITGPGSIMAVSWLFERMRWFQDLTSDAKKYTVFGMAVLIGCGALAVVTYVPISVLTFISPYFAVISAVFFTVFVAETFHKADKAG